MGTIRNKSSLNITLTEDTRQAIAELARRNEVPDTTLAARLIDIALELEEDMVWDNLATVNSCAPTPKDLSLRG